MVIKVSAHSHKTKAKLVEAIWEDCPFDGEKMQTMTKGAGDLPVELRALNGVFATVTLSRDGLVTRANNLMLRLFGYELEELTGRRPDRLFADEAELAKASAAVRASDVSSFISRCVAKDGRTIWVRCRVNRLTGDEGHGSEIVMILEDVSTELARISDDAGQITAINQSHAIAQFGLDGTLLDANALFLSLMRYDLSEVVGRHHSLFVGPAEAGGADYAEFWRQLGEGRPHAAECRRIRADGQEIWLQATYSPVRDIDGRVYKVVKHASDVTAEKLRQAEYRWQVTAVHKSHCVIAFDTHGSVLEANDHFLEATGYALEDIVGRHHRMFLDPVQAFSTEYGNFWRDLGAGKHRSGQYKRRCKDGREIWLQATYNPIFDTSGKVMKIIKYATVVTQDKLQQAEHQGQIAAIHRSQCVISFDLNGNILDANDNFLTATGYRYAQLRGRHHSMLVAPDYAESTEYKAFWASLARGEYQAGEFKRYASDGSEIWVQATYNPIFDMNGRPFRIIKYASVVTDEKLRQADFQGQIEAITKSQGVITMALDGSILDANENFLAMLGYGIDDLRGKHHRMLVEPNGVDTEEYVRFWARLRSGNFHSGMYKRIGRDGREVWIQATYNPILDLNGNPFKVIKFATDVTSNVALAAAFENASREAQHDSATALPNRTRLASFMAKALEQPGTRLAVLYLDLDRFKPVNDTFGHHVGDRVLGDIADRLRRTLTEDQIAARVGGDEFVVAAPNLSDEEVEALCQRLLDLVKAPIRHDQGEVEVGLSIGVAVSPADGTMPDVLLRHADAALYKSKENGRGTYSFYGEAMNRRTVDRKVLADDMRRGIAADEFYLDYQPRFGTRTRAVQSVEALVRWTHPELGRMAPAEFIPFAESSGMIIPLGKQILEKACRAVRQWPGIRVSVNVSAVQVSAGNLVEVVRDALAKAGIDGDRLELEITESVLLTDTATALTVLTELKTLGIRLAIDDFGTGYSSLSYLREFPFDVIKIDRQFVSDIENNPEGRAIVQAILGLGKALGLAVTAEGVETNGQLALLTLDQCSEVQGFLLARPLAEAAVAAVLQPSAEQAPKRPPSILAAAKTLDELMRAIALQS